MPGQDHEIALLIGRVEGKVDTLVHLTTQTSQRIDNLDSRMGVVEQKVASQAASGSSGRAWVANIISTVAAVAAMLALYKGSP